MIIKTKDLFLEWYFSDSVMYLNEKTKQKLLLENSVRSLDTQIKVKIKKN